MWLLFLACGRWPHSCCCLLAFWRLEALGHQTEKPFLPNRLKATAGRNAEYNSGLLALWPNGLLQPYGRIAVRETSSDYHYTQRPESV